MKEEGLGIMKKKRPVGVIIFAVLAIIGGILLCWNSVMEIYVSMTSRDKLVTCGFYILMQQVKLAIRLIFGISCVVSGIFLLLLKKWARGLFLFLMTLWLFLGAWFTNYSSLWLEGRAFDFIWLFWAFLIFVLPSLIGIYYFTHRSVRKIF